MLPDAPTTDDDSEMNSDRKIVWAKCARGVWGMGHSFVDKLHFTRDIPEDKCVPKDLLAPVFAKPPAKRPNHRPRVLSKASLWKVVSMFRNSRSNGAGGRSFTLSQSRSKFHSIGSPLSACTIFIFLQYSLSFVTVC